MPWNIYRYKELRTVDYDREYQALKDVESLKMAEAVIKPMEYQFLNDSTRKFFEVTQPYERMLGGIFSPVQIQAIKAATKLAGVTMIQGDTGRRETIFGIMSTLLSLK